MTFAPFISKSKTLNIARLSMPPITKIHMDYTKKVVALDAVNTPTFEFEDSDPLNHKFD